MIPAAMVLALAPRVSFAWRSALYPDDWTRDATYDGGRFLHDFSWAGYRAGEAPLPDEPAGAVLDVTVYGADPTGSADSTAAIQQAIDDASAAGGGVVHLPAGTYRVAPPAGKSYALHIGASGVVLRGDGPTSTFLVNTATDMRDKAIVHVRPDPDSGFDWHWGGWDDELLVEDAPVRAASVRVASTDAFAAGDWIVLRSDPTDAFMADYGMSGTWTADVGGPAFYRRIVAIDAVEGILELDAPLRLPLLVRDAARVYHVIPHLEEVGIEGLAIGNVRNTTSGTSSDDYSVPGTGAYQMHASFAIYVTHVVNGWVRDVRSFAPAGNPWNVHLLSNGLRVACSRFVTVADTDLRHPQYRGKGGNGYLFVHSGSDSLFTRVLAVDGRHNFSFSLMQTTGNVIHRSESRDGQLPADFHMWLSAANLIDNLTLTRSSFEAVRRECCGHGHSTTQSVFWNLNGAAYPLDQFFQKYIVDTAQFGDGFVIGTRGLAPDVRTPSDVQSAPGDFVEGVGLGAQLEPSSLYEDQLARRLGLLPPDPPANAAPVVDAGESQTIDGQDLPAKAELIGEATDDGLPGPIAVQWSVVSGPGAVGFDDPFSAVTAAAFSVAGTYVLRLTADDSELSATDDVTVTVTAPASSASHRGGGCNAAGVTAPAAPSIATILAALLVSWRLAARCGEGALPRGLRACERGAPERHRRDDGRAAP